MSDKHKLKGNIITPLRIIENGEVCFENGVITYVRPQARGRRLHSDRLRRPLHFPGFIDIHVHGGGGI